MNASSVNQEWEQEAGERELAGSLLSWRGVERPEARRESGRAHWPQGAGLWFF